MVRVQATVRDEGRSPHRSWMVIGSVVSVQIGASYAHRLMDEIGATATVMLRQGIAALVLGAICRPSLRGRTRRELLTVGLFGLILAAMNVTFYSAVLRLPLGVAVAIELLGPLGLAAALARRATDLVWVAVAFAGVAVLSLGDRSLDTVGVVAALTAAGCWALYILVSRRTGQHGGLDTLALAMVVATIAVAPFGLHAGPDLLHVQTLLLGLTVAMLGALIPFSLEFLALRAVPTRVFGVLMSLSPVAATLSGFVVLGEQLTLPQMGAMALVAIASLATARAST